jgi:hypothetical protein
MIGIMNSGVSMHTEIELMREYLERSLQEHSLLEQRQVALDPDIDGLLHGWLAQTLQRRQSSCSVGN